MTGQEMINNITEIFGTAHILTHQIKKIVQNYGDSYAKIFYETIIEDERANVETQIINLQKRLDKLNSI